jgi:hypothetical protein
MLRYRLIVNSQKSNLRVLTRNPAAAHDQVILIKHRRLAGCDGAKMPPYFVFSQTFR